jgi:hypothetical protein
MNFLFKFIVIGRLNIWQLVQLIVFSKSFTGLLHFCDFYFSSRNITVTAWCSLHYSEFPTKLLPILKWNSFECLMSDTTLKSWIFLCISKDYSYLASFLIKKMLIFAISEIYIHICCIYVYTYLHIIPNFKEKHHLKFKTKLIRWLKVC